jgi:hypothetical protein
MTDNFSIITSFLFYPAFSTVIVYLWINTSVFVEYVKVLGLGAFFDIEGFEKKNEQTGASFTYPDYLCLRGNTFFTRLISCPVCLTVWVQIAILIFHWNFALLFYSIYISWILYFILTKLSL